MELFICVQATTSNQQRVNMASPPAQVNLKIFLGNLLEDLDAFIEYVLCEDPTELCHLGYCEHCPKKDQLQALFDHLEDTISYRQWIKTDYMDFKIIQESKQEFTDRFKTLIPKMITHHFVYRNQKQFLKELKLQMNSFPNAGVMTVDFGQNYSFVVQNAVQGFHWTNTQATIHPFVLHFSMLVNGIPEIRHKTYFVISDEKRHDATVFHIFRQRVIELIKNDFPSLTKLYYESDGKLKHNY